MRNLFLATLAVIGASTAPVLAQDAPQPGVSSDMVWVDISVSPAAPEGLVYKTIEGETMPSLRGQPGVDCGMSACMATFAGNPGRFAAGRVQFCVLNTGNYWPVNSGQGDWRILTQGDRRAWCTTVGADGSFRLRAPVRRNATPVLVWPGPDGRDAVGAWVARDSLAGFNEAAPMISFE